MWREQIQQLFPVCEFEPPAEQSQILEVETALGVWPIPAASQYPAGTPITLLIRPEAASLEPGGSISIEGELATCLFRGRFYQVTLMVAGQALTFELPAAPAG